MKTYVLKERNKLGNNHLQLQHQQKKNTNTSQQNCWVHKVNCTMCAKKKKEEHHLSFTYRMRT